MEKKRAALCYSKYSGVEDTFRMAISKFQMHIFILNFTSTSMKIFQDFLQFLTSEEDTAFNRSQRYT